MAKKQQNLAPSPCVQCGRPAVAAVGLTPGVYVNVCLEHFHQHEEQRLRKIEMYARAAEDAEDQMMDSFGLPRKVRPHRMPPARVQMNQTNNQINIHGHNLGIVNQGTVGQISNNLTIIQGQDASLAEQLRQLTEAVIASGELSDSQKGEAIDLIGELVDDVARPTQPKKPRSVMKAISVGLGHVLSNAANLATLWSAVQPHLKF